MTPLEIYNKTKQNLESTLTKGWMKPLFEELLDVNVELINNTDVASKINAFKPTQGWVQTLDEVVIYAESLPKGSIQSAEFINVEGNSLHLRAAGSKTLITEFTKGQGAPLICAKYKQFISLKGEADGKQQAYYKVYWDPEDTKQPKYSRFVSIKSEDKK